MDDDVQARLAAFRRDLYGGRGPGITERERLRNTSLRAEIAGLPSAALREDLHLRTLRARGDGDQAALQTPWADAQFGGAVDRADAGAAEEHALLPTLRPPPPRRSTRRRLAALLGFVAVLLCARRRAPRGSGPRS